MSAVVAVGVGTGIAGASGPNLTGQTYSQASEKIASWGSKAVISSVVGDQLAMDDCIVTGSSRAGFLDSSGRKQDSAFLLNLNCDGSLAAAGKPGVSAASPQGRKQAKELKSLAWYDKDPTRCDGESLEYCKQLCQKYADKCSAELLQVLG
ncbi:hypothetical protein FHT40_001471 [Mycolicibacterium sp. BK556]|uniref:hypothetical protein n=1 Tax=Mycobacteriaceae TaxID=1762 RepID=UPI00105EEB89|nr:MULTISPECIES: hypothetical protein [Mycobacteriaceae]MBB3601838.1 hypothetical protein [Mycolicibacterium sp. BK556]MBB3631590.1 hypothetical protein [Mycolicibacterium sp. BK607]MBB3749594.1 hypothetical protein [Mycolicibacterium sp. BK634]